MLSNAEKQRRWRERDKESRIELSMLCDRQRRIILNLLAILGLSEQDLSMDVFK